MNPISPSTSPAETAPGDRVPDLLLPDAGGNLVSFYDKAAGDLLAVAIGPDPGALMEAFGGDGALSVFVVAHGPPAAAPAPGANFRGHLLFDPEGRAPAAFGFAWERLGGTSRVYLLDPNQRLLERFEGEAGEAARACRERARSLELFGPGTSPRELAPVLMIPRVFEPGFCRRLIQVFHTGGHEESGVYSLSDGELRHGVDHSMKRRFDHYVRDEALGAEISRRMSRRVLPEIDKAFCYRVTRLEEFKIACYRASEQGYFRPHRDNYSPQTLHRRFALTLNLNSAEYEGGELRFPEYGPHRYKPETGEAIVFSCSLLHEATDVTRGERYVLLAFLYGEDGARQKQEMARRMGSKGC